MDEEKIPTCSNSALNETCYCIASVIKICRNTWVLWKVMNEACLWYQISSILWKSTFLKYIHITFWKLFWWYFLKEMQNKLVTYLSLIKVGENVLCPSLECTVSSNVWMGKIQQIKPNNFPFKCLHLLYCFYVLWHFLIKSELSSVLSFLTLTLCIYNVCPAEKRTKRSSNILLRLVRFSAGQTLV